MSLTQSLRKVPVLAEVPEDQIQWIIDSGASHEFKEGNHFFQG